MTTPIYASANGNTFLIFDYLFSTSPHSAAHVRSHHQSHPSIIDSSLVLELTSTSTNSSANLGHMLIKMFVYEPGDGFCGNGARAVADYLYTKYKGYTFSILCGGYVHELVREKTSFLVEMGTTLFTSNSTWIELAKDDRSDAMITMMLDRFQAYYTCTSEPHLVIAAQEPVDDRQIIDIGTRVNTRPDYQLVFPFGVNVNFFTCIGPSAIQLTTFERGIQRLTQACGSGATSTVALALKLNKVTLDAQTNSVSVLVRSNTWLCVRHMPDGKVFLSGDTCVHSDDGAGNKNGSQDSTGGKATE